MNSVHACLFHKGYCKVFFSDNKQNRLKLPHSAQRKNVFLVKLKEKPKSQKQIPKKLVSLELLHQRLGQVSTRSLLAGDTEFFWQDIELRVDPDPFYTLCLKSTINKKARSKTPLKSNTLFKWVFMDIIPATYYKSLTSDTNFTN